MSEIVSTMSSTGYAAAVAARIRAARAVLGLSQKALAKEAGISQPALNVLERQESSPRLSTIESIESVLRGYGVEFSVDRDGNHTITLRAELVETLVKKHADGEAVTSRGHMHRRRKEE